MYYVKVKFQHNQTYYDRSFIMIFIPLQLNSNKFNAKLVNIYFYINNRMYVWLLKEEVEDEEEKEEEEKEEED